MVPDVADAENKIRSELMMNLKAPVLDHGGTAVARPRIAWIALEISIQESGIIGISRRGESRKPRIQRTFTLHEDGRKIVWGGKSRIDCGPTAERIAKVGVEERRMVDTVSTADYRLAEPAESFLRS